MSIWGENTARINMNEGSEYGNLSCLCCHMDRTPQSVYMSILFLAPQSVKFEYVTSYLATTTKWNFNWSLWGVSHLGQAELLDCNQIQSHVAGNNWWWLLDMKGLFFTVRIAGNLR